MTTAAPSDHPFCAVKSRSPAEFRRVKDIRPFLPAQAATVAITIPRVGKCTGAYVSDEGHVLTASHCIDACGETCTLELNGSLVKAHVLMRGTCRQAAFNLKLTLRQILGTPQSNPCETSSDVAVLIPEHPVEPVRCLPIQLEYRVGEPLYTLGYPAATRRGKGDSNGEDLYESAGEIIPPRSYCVMISNSNIVENVIRIQRPGSKVKLAGFSVNVLRRRGFLQTTLDVNAGSSGGPLINAEGEVIAVTSGFPVNWPTQIQGDERECQGSTFFAPLRDSENGSVLDANFSLANLSCRRSRAAGR